MSQWLLTKKFFIFYIFLVIFLSLYYYKLFGFLVSRILNSISLVSKCFPSKLASFYKDVLHCPIVSGYFLLLIYVWAYLLYMNLILILVSDCFTFQISASLDLAKGLHVPKLNAESTWDF